MNTIPALEVFIIDTSSSMGWLSKNLFLFGAAYIETCKKIIIYRLKKLRDKLKSKDLFAVVRFNDVVETLIAPKLISEFDRGDEDSINSLRAESDTALYEAIEYCSIFLSVMEDKNKNAKTELRFNIFTDGKDTMGNESELKRLLDKFIKKKGSLNVAAFIFLHGNDSNNPTGGSSNGPGNGGTRASLNTNEDSKGHSQMWFISCSNYVDGLRLLEKAVHEATTRFGFFDKANALKKHMEISNFNKTLPPSVTDVTVNNLVSKLDQLKVANDSLPEDSNVYIVNESTNSNGPRKRSKAPEIQALLN